VGARAVAVPVPRHLGEDVLNVVVENRSYDPPSVSDAAAWQGEYDLSFPVLADISGSFAPVWSPDGTVPTTYVLDQQGRVRWSHGRFDATTAADVEDQITPLLP
jgi:peroxiredoxin